MDDDRPESEEREAAVVPFPAQHPSQFTEADDVAEDVPEEGAAEQFDLDFGWLSGQASPESPEIAPTDGEGAEQEQWDVEPASALTAEHYVKATTHEYEELARAMDEADTRSHVPQAVSVAVPGLEHGIVGFEDVVGEAEPAIEPEVPDLFVRVATGAALAAVFLVAFLLPERAFLAGLVVVVGLMSLLELYWTVRVAGFNPMVLFGVLGSAGILIGAWLAQTDAPYATASFTAATIVLLMLWYVLTGMRRPLENGALTLLGVVWIAALMSFAMPIINATDYRPLVLFIIIVNTSLDVGSYFIGRGLGRTKLAPVLSPQKTVEGLLGGAIIALGIGAGLSAISYFDTLDVSQAVGLAAVIITFAPLGDLTESLVKRSLGVKDMGSILPGHGGLLDRIDGLILVLPASYYALLWMGIIQ